MPGRANLKGYLKAFKRQRTKAFGQYKHLDKNPDIVILLPPSSPKTTSLTAEQSLIWQPQEEKFFSRDKDSRNCKLKIRRTMTKNDYTTVCPYHNKHYHKSSSKYLLHSFKNCSFWSYTSDKNPSKAK